MIDKSLYDGDLVFLGAFNDEEDAILEAAYSHDPAYAYYLSQPAMSLSVDEVKKRHERLINKSENTGSSFIFAIKLILENRLIGFLSFDQIAWTHGSADLTLAVGDRSVLFDSIREAFQLGLVYAFLELNLFRLTMKVPDYDPYTLKILEMAGFVREVSQREAEYFDNRFWDLHYYGLLKEDWEKEGEHA